MKQIHFSSKNQLVIFNNKNRIPTFLNKIEVKIKVI